MGSLANGSLPPINEAVAFLDSNHAGKLSDLRAKYPGLDEDLKPGIIAGEVVGDGDADKLRQYLIARANIQLEALLHLVDDASSASLYCKDRISVIRRLKMGGEILVLIGSSAVIGTLNFETNVPTVVAAIATFSAACAALFVDHIQRIVNPELGDVFNAFMELVSLSRSADTLYRELNAAVEIQMNSDIISELISNSNELLSKANKWQPQVLSL